MWMDLLSAFLQKLFELVITPLIIGLIGLLGAWLTQKIKEARTKLTFNQNMLIDDIVNSAVLAAEQVKLTDALIVKRDYAINFAEQALAQRGIKLELNEIEARIEAAVWSEFTQYKKNEANTTEK